MMTNRLYYGDNLEILRTEIKDESVDLIYPDMAYGAQTFKHAKKEEGVEQQKGLF